MAEEDKDIIETYLERTGYTRARVYRITRSGRRTVGSIYAMAGDMDIEGKVISFGPGVYAVRPIKDGKMTETDYYYHIDNPGGFEEAEAAKELRASLLRIGEPSWQNIEWQLSNKGLEASIEDFIYGRRAAKQILNGMDLEELRKVSYADIGKIIEREARISCVKRMRKIKEAEGGNSEEPSDP